MAGSSGAGEHQNVRIRLDERWHPAEETRADAEARLEAALDEIEAALDEIEAAAELER